MFPVITGREVEQENATEPPTSRLQLEIEGFGVPIPSHIIKPTDIQGAPRAITVVDVLKGYAEMLELPVTQEQEHAYRVVGALEVTQRAEDRQQRCCYAFYDEYGEEDLEAEAKPLPTPTTQKDLQRARRRDADNKGRALMQFWKAGISAKGDLRMCTAIFMPVPPNLE